MPRHFQPLCQRFLGSKILRQSPCGRGTIRCAGSRGIRQKQGFKRPLSEKVGFPSKTAPMAQKPRIAQKTRAKMSTGMPRTTPQCPAGGLYVVNNRPLRKIVGRCQASTPAEYRVHIATSLRSRIRRRLQNSRKTWVLRAQPGCQGGTKGLKSVQPQPNELAANRIRQFPNQITPLKGPTWQKFHQSH